VVRLHQLPTSDHQIQPKNQERFGGGDPPTNPRNPAAQDRLAVFIDVCDGLLYNLLQSLNSYCTIREAMGELRTHYAVRNKAKLFVLFDQGQRPSDIAEAPVTRRTLYQYYWEWRKERGIEGKKTGFAIKPFDRASYQEAKRQEELAREQEHLARWVRDYEIVLTALKRWSESLGAGGQEETSPKVYLPTQGSYRWLNHVMTYTKGEPGPFKGWRSRLPIIERNLTRVEAWVRIAREVSSLTEFKNRCVEEVGVYPAQVEDY
jgi:hypothetical protein